jgi:transposase-like protein
MLFEMQRTKVNCIRCKSDNVEVGVHVVEQNGIAVYEKYTCRRCTEEFFEKDLHNEES